MTPLPTNQPPGVHHRRVGDALVTVLNDGHARLPTAVYLGCDAAEAARLSAAAFGPPVPFTAINALLVRTPGLGGTHTTLIDAGAGTLMGPTLGHLPAALAAAGIRPEDIDTLLLTHMHADHLGGALTGDGHPAFPRAELLFPAADAAFYLDPARLHAAPDDAKPRFAVPRRVVDAYAGRARSFGEGASEDGALPPGIAPLPLPGHSPGHTGFTIGTGPGRLLFWADLLHLPALQAPRPGIGVTYDSDPAAAVATRRTTLDLAATERLLVNGSHMDFPGFAHVSRSGDGYALTWDAWAPEL